MKKKIWFIIIPILVVLGGLVSGFFFLNFRKTLKEITVEAGTKVVPCDFNGKGAREIYFSDGRKEIDTPEVGDFTIEVNADYFKRKCLLHVVDTISPEVAVTELTRMPGEAVSPEDFIVEIKDATETEVSFAEPVSTERSGDIEVSVIVKDKGNNATFIETMLHVVKVNLEEPYEWEASDTKPEADFFLLETGSARYTGDGLDQVDFKTPGVYPVTLTADGTEVEVYLRIVDTVAPKITMAPVHGYLAHPLEAGRFVESFEDETELTFEYESEPDWTKEEPQTVSVIATDLGGNICRGETELTLELDVEPPYILGAGNITAVMGETVSYRKGVSAYDDCDGEIELEIDNSQVDLTNIGSYDVTYTATDSSGNSISQTVKLSIIVEAKELVTLEQMYLACDDILSDIITPDMSQYDQAHAIFTWIRSNVYFVDDSQKEDWIQSAYDAIITGRGDCYNFASLSKALLTRAGIPNVDVKRKSVLSKHYWNLVDTGDGWYHFDTTPRLDKTVVFMWSESELQHDEAVRRSHVYDKSLYPEVNWE